MRRSSRSVKQPELFSFNKNKNDNDDDDNNNDNNDNNNANDSDDSDDDIMFYNKKKTKKGSSNKKTKKVSDLYNDDDDDNDNINDDNDNDDNIEKDNKKVTKTTKPKKVPTVQQKTLKKGSNTLYDVVSSGPSKKVLDDEIDNWINKYKINKIAALVIIVNFVLISSGAKKNWIDNDIDLDALDADEISEILNPMVAALTKGEDESRYYPLSQISKTGKVQGGKYRETYSKLWATLANVLTDIDAEEAGLKDLSILNVVVQQLIQLSSMHLYSLRDAATEAALSIGGTIVEGMKTLTNKSEAMNRLLNAESSKSGKNSAKYIAMQKQKKLHDKVYESLLQMKSDIFNSILVHRFKDTNDNIRVMCISHFGNWLRSDPQTMYKDDNLKYIAWSFFDDNCRVRREAVSEFGRLLEIDDHVHLLNNVTARFMQRMIEMAVGDSEEIVQIEMIKVFRLLQQKGMLDDTISEEQLDKLDKIIFDYTLPSSIRKEALSFFMDHTEGFDADEDDDEEPAKKAKTSKQYVKNDDTKALARKQKLIVQLETFIELAEHLIEDEDFDRVDLLAQACLDHPQSSNVLKDWSSIISLLLRENDGDISTALSEAKVSILLRMFVYSANQLVTRKQEIFNAKASPNKSMRTKGPVITLTGELGDAWESLVENLHKDLPKLFTRFRDDTDNLNILIDLFKCFDDSSSSKALKSILKLTMDLLDSNLPENSLIKLVSALKKWSLTNAREATMEAVSKFHTGQWNRVLSSIEELKNAPTSSTSTTTKSKGKKSKSSSSNNNVEEELEETMYRLSSSILKYKIIWKNFDCADLIDQNIDQLADELVEITDLMVSHLENPDLEKLWKTCVESAKDAADTIFAMLLWPTKVVYTEARKLNESEDEENFEVADLEININAILSLREKLVDVLLTWMKSGHTHFGSQSSQSSSASSALTEHHSFLKQCAFKVMCDLRNIYPIGNKTCKIVDQLAFMQSAEELGWMKSVFEHEGAHYKKDLTLHENNDDDDRQNDKTAKALVETLINPLIKSIVFDINNLNKRQAASVISYLAVSNDIIQTAVLNMMIALKNANTLKALEVQLVALKDYYSDNIQTLLRIRDEENTNYDYDQNDKEIEEHSNKLEVIAENLAKTLGNNKASGSVLKGLELFFKSCIDFALKDIYNLGFVSFLRHYHKLLPVRTSTAIANHLDHILQANEELVDIMERNDTTVDVSRFYDFRDLIKGSGKRRTAATISSYSPLKLIKKTKAASRKKNELNAVLEEDNDDDEINDDVEVDDYEEDNEEIVTGKRSRSQSQSQTSTKSKSRAVKTTKSKSQRDYDDDDEEEQENVTFNTTSNTKVQQYGKKRSSSSSSFGLVLENVDSDEESVISEEEKVKSSQRGKRSSQGSQKFQSQSTAMELNDDDDEEEDDDDKDIFADLVNVPIRSRYRR